MFGLSRSSIYAFFHKAYNSTVLEYITQKRIELAVEMLEATTLSITDIATAVGIENYNYFIRMFKKNVGISPLKFRKGKNSNKYSGKNT